MLSPFAKFLLVATSLAPVLGAFAVNAVVAGSDRTTIGVLIALPVLLVVICLLVLRYAKSEGGRLELVFESIRTKDENVLAFLVAYLLPLFTRGEVEGTKNLLTGAYVLAVIFLAMTQSNAYHFNPVLGLFGYHFYEAESGDEMPVLLITPKVVLKSAQVCTVVQVSSYVFLQVEEP